MRTVIYARKSTEGEDRQVQSLEDQIRALTQVAAREGLRVSEIFQESKSAKAPGNRPEFERLVRDVEDGKVGTILTWSIDRLSRNPVDGGRIAYLLHTGKISQIRTPERCYRPEDNALLLSIENGMATAFLQNLSRNVRRGMESKVAKGWLPGKAPIGYLNDPLTHEIVVDPERFHLVRAAWDMLLYDRLSTPLIHKRLLELGLTFRSYRRGASPVSQSWVYSALHNPFYMGMLSFRGESRPGSHVPMVSRSEFDRAQQILSGVTRRARKTKLDLPFSHAMTCGNCGCSVVADRKHKVYNTGRAVTYVYYRCSASKGCTKVGIGEADLIAAINVQMSRVAIPDPVARFSKKCISVGLEAKGYATGEGLASLERQVAKIEDRIKRLTAMRVDGELTRAEYSAFRQELDSEMHVAMRNLEQLRNEDGLLMRAIEEQLDVAVLAGELSGGRHDLHALGQFLRTQTATTVTLGKVQVKFHPVLEFLAKIELPKISSERPVSTDFSDPILAWQSIVSELRKLVSDDFRNGGSGGPADPPASRERCAE